MSIKELAVTRSIRRSRCPLSMTTRNTVVALLATALTFVACTSQATDAEIAVTGLQFPEGTVFVGPTLYFVDYAASNVYRLKGKSAELVWHKDGCGANGLVSVPGGLVVACYENDTLVRISLDGRTEKVVSADDREQRFISPNDLTSDARGGFYFSASGSESSPGKVYYRSSSGQIRQVATNIHYANGLAVSPDGKTLYLAESADSRLLAFSIYADGALGPQREFVELGDVLSELAVHEFTPDGVRVDKDGNLFVGLYRGGGIAILSPAAKLLKYVKLAGAHHANLALSPDGRTVVVTSADERPDGSYRGQLLTLPNPIGN